MVGIFAGHSAFDRRFGPSARPAIVLRSLKGSGDFCSLHDHPEESSVLIVPTYLEKSPIHGFGVFARTHIKKGARVWEFHEKLDIRLTQEEFDLLPPSVKEELNLHMYEPEPGGPFFYEATMGKYMNHSRSANVDFSVVGVGVATRDIEEGEEITCDYRDFMSNWADYTYI